MEGICCELTHSRHSDDCCVTDGFNTVMRSPCVVFTGHPSLRFGDAVHFMELWGPGSANAVIFTGIDIVHPLLLRVSMRNWAQLINVNNCVKL